MGKTLWYRVFGVGKIPSGVMPELQREGIVLVDEGVAGSVTYRNFRSPRRIASWKRQWYTAAIALTKTRLYAQGSGSQIISVPLNDARIRSMHPALENNGETLAFTFDAGLFHADWSGTIEYRFKVEDGQRWFGVLKDMMEM